MIHKRKRIRYSVLMLSLLLLVLAAAGCGSKEKEPKSSQTMNAEQADDLQQGSGSEETGKKQWDKMPEMSIDPSKQYSAVFHTSKGEFTVQLFAEDAPTTVNSFVFLAKNKFYNDITFHRIIETFMIQTGDPTGTGTGGPGYNIPDELGSDHKYDIGTVAMANTGMPDSGGSQFFICTGDVCSNLNSQPNYTIFGQVTDGMDSVMAIAKTPVGPGADGNMSKPLEKVTIDSIDIIEK
nr:MULTISPECIES: peptidylprolyl isomerase [Paenibacillus]